MQIKLLLGLLLFAKSGWCQSGSSLNIKYSVHVNSKSVKPYKLSPFGAYEFAYSYQSLKKVRFSFLGDVGISFQRLNYRLIDALQYNNNNTYITAAFSAGLFNIRRTYLFTGIGTDILLAHVEEVKTNNNAHSSGSPDFDEVMLEPTQVNASVIVTLLQPLSIMKNNRWNLAIRLKQNVLQSYTNPIYLDKVLNGIATQANPRLTNLSVGVSYKLGKHGQRSDG